MRLKLLLPGLALLILLSKNSFSQHNNINKESFLYSVKGNDSLFMDRYHTYSYDPLKQNPSIIFMFGGGFMNGKRDNARYISFYNYYASKGYNVFAIDYRLGLKDLVSTEKVSYSGFVELMKKTINIAVEDLYDATNFIINNSEEWSIDTSMIVISGSSAGAISVLQGEYFLATNNKISERLPSEFRYAGVISFAGGIFCFGEKMKWTKSTTPIQLFHGDIDANVPYNKISVFNKHLYGSLSIANELTRISSPHYFYSFENVAHEISGTPMNHNRDDIDTFLTKFVYQKKQLIINKSEVSLDNVGRKKRVKLKDYINSNFKK